MPLIGLRVALQFGLIKLHPSLCVTRERNVKSAEKQATSVGLCRKSLNNEANNRSTIRTIRSNQKPAFHKANIWMKQEPTTTLQRKKQRMLKW